ncbi:sensor histidine kinase [Nocardioides sp. AX2bis]|uniref:sensor histidine kinase n=1 Tax=Nocardioides sp. AX2bis TaxID=2653157 RepID=UPI0012EFBC5B|nr:GAF domain-containing protein [Nocardioides sp. AX2bis]VXC49643.1 Signal transduction histidine kinase [Nocardioides sp. AX2bis]
MTTATENAVSPARTERRGTLIIWLLAGAMVTLAALITAPAVLDDPGSTAPDVRWFALLPLFALAEIVVIHLPTQHNAHGHTLREIPAVLGLTFLAPQQYVSVYVVGAVLGLVVAARMRGVKLAFNAAMFALEAALGALTYHAILQGGDPLSPVGWLAVLVAVLVTDLVSAGAVTAGISLTEGAFDGEILREALRSGSVAAFINTCIALLVATLVLVQPSALPLLGVVVVLLVLAYRVYVSLARGHARTHLLYRFVDRTSSARSVEEVVEVVLREAADLMYAERSYLVEVVDEQQVQYQAFTGGTLHTEAVELLAEPWWWSALEAGVVQHEAPRRGHDEVPEHPVAPALTTPPRDGLAAQLRGTGSTRYLLVVCDRSFEKETFGDEDVQVFEALAAHAGVAIERARIVSDLQTLAGELKTARDTALAVSEAKSMFLANMSHEVRTPLTTVLAAGELLNETPLDESQVKLLGRMHRSGELLLSLVENLLDFSRIDAGHATLHHAELDLRAMVADIADAHEPRAQAEGIAFDCVVDPRVPSTVVGDRTRIVQVLTNLLGNALKFTAEGGRVRLDVRPVEDDSGPGVRFTVSDTGIGIDEDHQASIFTAFSQVDGSATRRYAGTGLGLAICKQLTELMGGVITVAGELGVGSTFEVRLPLVTSGTAPPPGTPTD